MDLIEHSADFSTVQATPASDLWLVHMEQLINIHLTQSEKLCSLATQESLERHPSMQQASRAPGSSSYFILIFVSHSLWSWDKEPGLERSCNTKDGQALRTWQRDIMTWWQRRELWCSWRICPISPRQNVDLRHYGWRPLLVLFLQHQHRKFSSTSIQI